jgi:hypothetical protein
MVRTAGLEPAQPFSRGILSPLRLPFRHVREHDILPRHISALLPCVNEQEKDDNVAGFEARSRLSGRCECAWGRFARDSTCSTCSVALDGMDLAGPAPTRRKMKCLQQSLRFASVSWLRPWWRCSICKHRTGPSLAASLPMKRHRSMIQASDAVAEVPVCRAGHIEWRRQEAGTASANSKDAR